MATGDNALIVMEIPATAGGDTSDEILLADANGLDWAIVGLDYVPSVNVTGVDGSNEWVLTIIVRDTGGSPGPDLTHTLTLDSNPEGPISLLTADDGAGNTVYEQALVDPYGRLIFQSAPAGTAEDPGGVIVMTVKEYTDVF
jgi:hypothetical protein